MPKTRVIWIPWREGSHECDFFERSRQWQGARPEKNYQIVSYSPGTRSPVLANICNGHNYIYLRGHGVPGDPTVNPTNIANNPNGITIYESIDRLMEMGLSNQFRGMMKFYSCFSGLNGADRTRTVYSQGRKYGFFGERVLKSKDVQVPRPEGTWDPLAMRGANYLRHKGFNQCSFWGYLGVCSGEMENEGEDDGKAHRHVQPMIVNPATGILEAHGESDLAANLRKRF